ncbi:MAG TPA: bifunctional UDP-N-acetylglucosamine diphosphorylase/glucosamine-1-phosphate N-acetyltransferase GlmU [SAR202 cluster bacterium]|mgnify:FL=1|jgi:bifunctional UDP-N-acetylglucosamine pyrophosphorylase/glucosamine-1-phosphate N-acetyltransferase|nr:bifunctional UDP-N-acetylglucosamine diphosphorylase/glucosamine-1-phosphate N-acetyltransferase GlmU [SAR202 cluster bacterium]
MHDFKAIILAAGAGTRMKSSLPKVLHKLSGKPMITLVMDSIVNAGVQDITAVVPSCNEPFKEALEEKIEITVQKHQKGSGHALLQCRQKASNIENILVINGDMPLIKAKTLSDLMAQHKSSKADLTLLTGKVTDPKDFGRIVRNNEGEVTKVVEESEANENQLLINEINAGAYCFKTAWLWAALESLKPSKSGEFFLTDLISFAESINLSIESISADNQEIMGVNNKSDLAKAEKILRIITCENLMETGVRIIDPDTTYIDLGVLISPDTVIFPNTYISGNTNISSNCEIGPNCEITNSSLGSSCIIKSSTIEFAMIRDNVSIGPYSHIREGSILNEDVSIGNYVEIKNSTLGRGTKSGHHCYLGDSDIGSNVNIGAGTITCNYDGEQKHRTTIRDDAFIGSDTKLVAPVTIGKQSVTGAGSIVTKDIPDFAKGVGSPARIVKEDRSS